MGEDENRGRRLGDRVTVRMLRSGDWVCGEVAGSEKEIRLTSVILRSGPVDLGPPGFLLPSVKCTAIGCNTVKCFDKNRKKLFIKKYLYI